MSNAHIGVRMTKGRLDRKYKKQQFKFAKATRRVVRKQLGAGMFYSKGKNIGGLLM